ncbi:hypothetical protein [Nocardia sp. NPDC019255]|uniref:hypothetical protein n=1 Tax=unclassified Nocardia TaxID=2637762 RepID=UPI0033E3B90D
MVGAAIREGQYGIVLAATGKRCRAGNDNFGIDAVQSAYDEIILALLQSYRGVEPV